MFAASPQHQLQAPRSSSSTVTRYCAPSYAGTRERDEERGTRDARGHAGTRRCQSRKLAVVKQALAIYPRGRQGGRKVHSIALDRFGPLVPSSCWHGICTAT